MGAACSTVSDVVTPGGGSGAAGGGGSSKPATPVPGSPTPAAKAPPARAASRRRDSVSAEAVSAAMLAASSSAGPSFVAVPPSIAEDEVAAGEAAEAPAPAESTATSDLPPARRVTKSPDAEAAITAAMDSCFLFADLDADQRSEVAAAMTRIYVEAGDVVIREGDAGDHFFVVEAGRFVATRAARPSEVGGKVEGGGGSPASPAPPPPTITLATYDGRGAFGELALLYGSPRAATVTAATAGVLWQMDRPAFRATVLRQRSARRAAIEASLSASPLLAALSPEARAAIADCVTCEEFEDGAVILAQGEPVTPASKLYFVESGRVVCLSCRDLGTCGGGGGDGGEATATTSTTVGPGGWFGEVALVEPAAASRAADCIASGRVRLLALGRDAFERVMGPAEAALGASVAAYRQMNEAADAEARAKQQQRHGSAAAVVVTHAPASPAPLPPPDYAPLVSGPAVVKEAGASGSTPRHRGSAAADGGGGRAIGKNAPASSGYGQHNKAGKVAAAKA